MTVDEYVALLEEIWTETGGREALFSTELLTRVAPVHIDLFGHLAPTLYERTTVYLRRHDDRSLNRLREAAEIALGAGGVAHVQREWERIMRR